MKWTNQLDRKPPPSTGNYDQWFHSIANVSVKTKRLSPVFQPTSSSCNVDWRRTGWSCHVWMTLTSSWFCWRQLEVLCCPPSWCRQQGHCSSHVKATRSASLLQLIHFFAASSCLFASSCYSDKTEEKIKPQQFISATTTVWLGGQVVGMLDLRSTGCGFESQPLHCRVQPWASC